MSSRVQRVRVRTGGEACADEAGGVDGYGVSGLGGLLALVAVDAVVGGEGLGAEVFAGVSMRKVQSSTSGGVPAG